MIECNETDSHLIVIFSDFFAHSVVSLLKSTSSKAGPLKKLELLYLELQQLSYLVLWFYSVHARNSST